MAYMARQFLKGNNWRLSGGGLINVLVSDNRDNPHAKTHPDRDDIEFILTLNRVDIKYKCENCGFEDIVKGQNFIWCKSCYEKESIVKTTIVGNRYQKVEFSQTEAENLLEGLLVKTSKKINPQTRIKLMGLLLLSEETE